MLSVENQLQTSYYLPFAAGSFELLKESVLQPCPRPLLLLAFTLGGKKKGPAAA